MSRQTALLKNQKGSIVEIVVFIVTLVILAFLLYAEFSLEEQKSPDETTKTSTTIVLPEDAIKVSECVPFMGDHWLQLDKLPNGPMYITHNGEVVGIEYMLIPDEIPGKETAMMSQAELSQYMAENNLSFADLMEQDHNHFDLFNQQYESWDIHWTQPHAGLPVPHYDIHFYFISEEERAGICPDAQPQDITPPELIEELIKLGVPLPETPVE